MAFERAHAAAMRLLSGMEDGTMTAAQSAELVEESDPALVYLVITWLRRRYERHANADAIIGRVLAVVNRNPRIAKLLKEGQADPVVAWFEEEYRYQDLAARDFIELVVDKLEG